MVHELEEEPTYAALRDLPALAEFAEVARWEHMTRAAERLGVPQPTLSRRIARLEGAVGFPLFHRRGRTLVLTHAGRSLATLVERALLDLSRGLDELTAAQHPESGVVTLGFLNALGVSVVPRLLLELRAEHPGLRVQLVQDGHDAVLERLRRDAVDVCLTAPPPADSDVSVTPLHRQRLVLVVPLDHRLAGRRRVRLAEVAQEVFVGFKPGYGLRSITADLCRRAGFAPRLAFEGEDVATVRGLVTAGFGVALLPPASPVVAGVRELRVTDPPAHRTIAMVTPRGRRLAPPAAALADFVSRRGAAVVADAL